MHLSIIVPAYNEENTIEEILSRVLKVKIDGIEKIEIIVVDDGSKDKTSDIVKKIAAQVKNITLIQHKKNKGKGAAVVTGIKASKGDILLIQDADLEYNPVDIPKLVAPILKKRARVVYGTRLRMQPKLFGKNKTPLLLHFFGNKFLSLVTSILYGAHVTDMETGYKVMDRNVLAGVILRSHSFDFEPEVTAKILKRRIKILELDIQTNPRGYAEGKKIRPVKDGSIALWTLIKYRFVN